MGQNEKVRRILVGPVLPWRCRGQAHPAGFGLWVAQGECSPRSHDQLSTVGWAEEPMGRAARFNTRPKA